MEGGVLHFNFNPEVDVQRLIATTRRRQKGGMGSLKQKTKEVVEAPLQRVLKKYTRADQQLGMKKEKAGTRPHQFKWACISDQPDQHLSLLDLAAQTNISEDPGTQCPPQFWQLPAFEAQ